MKPNPRRREAAKVPLAAVIALIIVSLVALIWEWRSTHPSTPTPRRGSAHHRDKNPKPLGATPVPH